MPKPPFPRIQNGHPLARGLKGAWLFAEGSINTAIDSSGCEAHGAGVAGMSSNQWFPGPSGWAYHTAGSMSFALGTMPHFKAVGPVTVSALTKEHSYATWSTYFQKGYDGATEPLVLRSNGGNFTFQTYNPTDNGIAVTDPNTHSLEVWYHVVGTFDGAKWALYVNGALVASVVTTTGPTDNTQVCGLLASYVGGPPSRIPDADVDHVMLWQRGMSAKEVADLYADPYAMFRRRDSRIFRSPIATINIRPDADDSNSGWTTQLGGTTNLYQVVDEAAPPNDLDYIWSSANPTSDIVRFRISDPTAAMAEPFKVRYRYGAVGVGSCTITVRLKQGTTTIKTWVHTDATVTLQTVTQTLSSGEYASITDFNDLFVEFEAGP